MVPLGLTWIASVLEEHGRSVRIVDANIEDIDIQKTIEEHRPVIAGIGGTTVVRFDSFKIARLIKEVDPSLLVVYGGPHATFTAEDTLHHIQHIDIVVRGEGEYTMLELVNRVLAKRDYDDILGISYRRNGRICHNSPRPRIKDLDSLPMPARHLLDMNEYRMDMPFLENITAFSVMSSRGCPIGCVFCSASALWGPKYTRRSPQKVLDEIQLLADQYGISGIKFFDSTLTLDKGHILGICDEFLRRQLNMFWECEVRADTVSYDLLSRMREAGCYYIDLGVESGSPRILKTIHKGITLEQMESAITSAYSLGMHIKCFFMTGLPGETLEDAMMTIEFMKKHWEKISPMPLIAPTSIYPGTPVEIFARERGYLPDKFSWSEPFESYPQFQEQGVFAPAPVPILIQPQFGYDELGKVLFEVDKMNGYLSLPKIIKKVLTIRSVNDVRRIWRYGKKFLIKGLILHPNC
jgi:radical SAM superfamily enzyme YgiQ (UPF0313 family)